MGIAAEIQQEIKFNKSVNGYNWALRPYDERTSLALSQKFELPEITARLLAAKGVAIENAEDFLNPSIKNSLPDPYHLIDMEKAAKRLAEAVKANESVVVFGDYDVDGATSSALLKKFFAQLGLNAGIYIPDRIDEGYGPNTEALLRLRKEGADVVITVDCGTVSFEPLEEAKRSGLEIIVIDHHIGAEQLPDAIAVVNPNRIDETSPHTNLAAVGLSFLLAVAISRALRTDGFFKNRPEPDIMQLLDLVALGTVCDVMPLTGLNRAYVSQGLKIMAKRNNLGLKTLADVARMDGAPAVYHAGFLLGPRINAGGRIGKAWMGAKLLSTDDESEAEQIALELDKLNEERKAIETLVLDEALALADKINDPVIIVAGEGWHPGVIGIVASRLKEKYRRPTAVIALKNGVGKASARSISGVDFGAAVTAARIEGLLIAGGGHKMAAGFTVEEKRLGEFKEFINSQLKNQVEKTLSQNIFTIDGLINTGGITVELAKSFEVIGPFGAGNSEPVFVLHNARIIKSDIVGEQHIRCIIGDGGAFPNPKTKLKAMAFRCLETPLGKALISSYGRDVHIAGKIKLNRWQGNETAEFHIEDMCLA